MYADLPLATALSGLMETALPKGVEILHKIGLFPSVFEMKVAAHEGELQIKCLQKFAANVATTMERFLGREVICELPYYLPRGIPLTVLTGKVKEAVRFKWSAKVRGMGAAGSLDDEDNLTQYAGVSKKMIEEPNDLLNYFGRRWR